MQKIPVNPGGSARTQLIIAGKPSIPLPGGRQPIVERKITDPSSASPKGERYPIPSFFEYRIRAREYDPL
jgi:hypothetical protein